MRTFFVCRLFLNYEIALSQTRLGRECLLKTEAALKEGRSGKHRMRGFHMECEKTLVGVRLRKLSIDTLVELDRARRMYHSYKTKRIPYFASIFVALEV